MVLGDMQVFEKSLPHRRVAGYARLKKRPVLAMRHLRLCVIGHHGETDETLSDPPERVQNLLRQRSGAWP